MADKRIQDLIRATTVNTDDLLVLEQDGAAKAITGNNFVTQIAGYAMEQVREIANIHVTKDNSGDYSTISAAVAAANDGDTIVVHEGTYTESVDATGKNVNIVGVNRDKCILQNSVRDRANPPLEMAKGSVSNLTVIGLDTGTQAQYNAYCMHIDSDNSQGQASKSQTLTVNNCKFYNPIHQAIGIGLRPYFTLTFNNCYIEAADQSALYFHDWEPETIPASDYNGQRLEVLNCVLKNRSYDKPTIRIQSQELADKCATVLFSGNSVRNHLSDGENATIARTYWGGSGPRVHTYTGYLELTDWHLDYSSSVNSEEKMNSVKLYPFYNNFGKFNLNNSASYEIQVGNWRPVILLGYFAEVGASYLVVSKDNQGNLNVTDALTGNAWAGLSRGYSFTITTNGIQMTTTQSSTSSILFIKPD